MAREPGDAGGHAEDRRRQFEQERGYKPPPRLAAPVAEGSCASAEETIDYPAETDDSGEEET
jgi:hypothetical protein